jgi:hypothetical protein
MPAFKKYEEIGIVKAFVQRALCGLSYLRIKRLYTKIKNEIPGKIKKIK